MVAATAGLAGWYCAESAIPDSAISAVPAVDRCRISPPLTGPRSADPVRRL